MSHVFQRGERKFT